jgi:hypothetical protein
MYELQYMSMYTTNQIILHITRIKVSDTKLRQELFLYLTAYIYW